ncbi:unnamed protein product [Strongylus vulgaris]|uniref:Beta-galactosidase n=1 Tax=Strongylus vulgaris TaxID=40348 RepID=A0A3P7IST9_STRVU|nr:unnamed protein product [Strongylus vulgaris]
MALGTFVNSYNGKSLHTVNLRGCTPGATLSILVENQGRQTYETINDYKNFAFKGILSDVEMDGKPLQNWTQCKLDIIHDYANITTSSSSVVGILVVFSPTTYHLENFQQNAGNYGVYHGVFKVHAPTDTFLNTRGWGKGVAIINGNNLGRFWATEGPQITLYVPAAFLRAGENSLLILELEGASNCTKDTCSISLVDQPIYVWKETTSSRADFFEGPRRQPRG